MLPHISDRPLALEAFPQGIEEHGFFMKSIPKHFPDWIATAEVPKRGGSLTQVLAREAATLVYLAGQNVVTPHVWLARADELRQPDRLILDFDPSPGSLRRRPRGCAGGRRTVARRRAVHLRDGHRLPRRARRLSRCGAARHSVPCMRFARALAEAMVADDPSALTLEWHRAERGARIYVDVNRINYAQHVVAPYGVRAKPRGPVAMPIEWDELSEPRLKPDRWTVRSAAGRLRDQGDAWREINRRARKLPESPHINPHSPVKQPLS